MKIRLFVGTMVALSILSVVAWAAVDVSGKWTGQITGPNGDVHDLTFNLKADGGKITGSISGGPPDGSEQAIANGKVEGDKLSFSVNVAAPDGSTISLTYTGKIADQQIRGTLESPMGNLPFSVARK